MTDHITIPESALSLLDQEGYMKRFYECLGEGMGDKQAYEKVEGEHLEHFRRHKYSNYLSFRVVRKRFIDKYRPKSKLILKT